MHPPEGLFAVTLPDPANSVCSEKTPGGSIGITPFLSMIREAVSQKSAHLIHLFYANRRPEDSAFLRELQDMAGLHTGFHLVATMSEIEKSKQPWKGERGFIDGAMLKRCLPTLNGPIYYTAGPPAIGSGNARNAYKSTN